MRVSNEQQIQQSLQHQLHQIRHPSTELSTIGLPSHYIHPESPPVSVAASPNYLRWSIPQLCLAASLAMVLYGVTALGDGWIMYPTMGYHALGMVVACVVCTQQRVLCTTPYVESKTSTYLYYATQAIGFVAGGIGMAVFYFLPNSAFVSFHSCTGVAFFASWVIQFSSRLIGWTRCATCFEHITYGLGICAAMMGLQYGTFKGMLTIGTNTSNTTFLTNTTNTLANTTFLTNTTNTLANTTFLTNTTNTLATSWILSPVAVTSILLLASGITAFIAISFT